MPLRVYNTLSRSKEPFEPLVEGRVNMYVCGPTVYDFPHIGHAKSYVSFDAIVRYLRWRNYDVLYVQNITDVGHLTDDQAADPEGEDKIAKRARERGLQPMQLVETFTREYFSAMDLLNCVRPDISPRATGHIPEMIALVQKLIAEGHAYESEGNVYFDVESFREYGKLSRRKLDDQEAGGRVEPGAGKRNAADFALWKSAEGTGHLMRWDSPWGVGFPGWHIECSAMSQKYLGDTLDIHGAGVDNMFPHNEDEIAQSECANHAPFARYWIHNGSVLVGGEKMAKSKGNFKTVGDEAKRWGAPLLRFWVLSSHYRSPVDYTESGLEDAGRGFERLRIALQGVERYLGLPAKQLDGPEPERDETLVALGETLGGHHADFIAAMDDDFNTPAAIAELFGIATALNRVTGSATERTETGGVTARAGRDLLLELAGVLGLELSAGESGGDGNMTGEVIDMLLAARQTLRKHKDFGASDDIRNGLKELGVVVEDRPEGPTWRLA